jgi:23S rRNA pseudouridine1911/1915/1917 synthase
VPAYEEKITREIPPALRLDRYIAEYLGLLTRSQIKTRNLSARINGRDVKISRTVNTGDMLQLSWAEAEKTDLVPEDIPLAVIYEDDRVIVVNKEQGMAVHPGAGLRSGTLANALLYRRLKKNIPPPAPSFRPGIVHRLDKDTSGVIIAAWDEDALRFLADQFKERTVKKTYAALVRGTPKENKGRIETRICRDSRDRKRFTVSFDTGKPAVTWYRVLHSWGGYSLLLLRPKTGRTHQIRVHLRYLGNPVAGDPVYGQGENFPGLSLMLHARDLSLVLPGHTEALTFTAPIPERFRTMIKALEGYRRGS